MSEKAELQYLRAIVSANITKELVKNGIDSYATFARENKIGVSTFYQILKGRTSLKMPTLLKIAKALGIEPYELLKP